MQVKLLSDLHTTYAGTLYRGAKGEIVELPDAFAVALVGQRRADALYNADAVRFADGSTASAVTSGSNLQFISGTAQPPVAAPADANLPAQYYNTSTKFSWNWNIGRQKWIPVPMCYRAQISQTGTMPATASVMENTLHASPPPPASPPWTRIGVGAYQLFIGFSVGMYKFFAMAQPPFASGARISITLDVTSSYAQINTVNAAGAAADSILDGNYIEVLVYP